MSRQAFSRGSVSPNRPSPNQVPLNSRFRLNHDPIHPERSSCGRELRDGFGLNGRRVVPPEALRIALLAAAIEMQQISPITRAVIRKPLVSIRDAALMEQSQPVAGSLAFVCNNRGNQRLVDRRLITPPYLKCRGVYIQLPRVPEKMSQQKKPQLGGDCIVNVDFQSVQV